MYGAMDDSNTATNIAVTLCGRVFCRVDCIVLAWVSV